MTTPPNAFSAADSTLGYIYQCRVALLLFLQHARVNPEHAVSIERLDDIAFEKGGTALELIQTKHHVEGAASLTDASPDLWKTIRVWCEASRTKSIALPATRLMLITTATAAEGSAASYLRAVNRNSKEALKQLNKVPPTSTNETNKAAYSAFTKLTGKERAQLVDAIVVVDRYPTVFDLRSLLATEVRWLADNKHLTSFLDRLEGWWFARVVSSLSSATPTSIHADELDAQLTELRHQFRADNLPIDLLLADPPDSASFATRVFVAQLRLIAQSEESIAFAIRDYYRAFEQRSRWVREDLLLVGELERFERRLIEEWQRRHARMKDDIGPAASDPDKARAGRTLLGVMEDSNVRIRPEVEEPFVRRGSLHMLADVHRVGWHPEFVDRLQALLAMAEKK